MKKLRTLVKDSYARALAAALVFTSFAFALTGGALTECWGSSTGR